MRTGSNDDFLTLSNTQAKELAGRLVTVGAETYSFKNYEHDRPGQPPWRSGAEGKAYPLLGYDRAITAYMKFFTRPTRKRFDRTAWLIGQQVHAWLPSLSAAPMVWGDTRYAQPGGDAPFDFAGYLARAVPGKTWLELKTAINDNSLLFNEEMRWRCVCDLLGALAVLEHEEIVHGDLSPNNIVIDVNARRGQPALYLIDFDAFVAPAAGALRAVSVAEGGTYGTAGYCPPALAAAAADGDGSIAPRSDRYGRDMLLMELLLMDCGLPADDPPSIWSSEGLRQRYQAARARSDAARCALYSHLDPDVVFMRAEQDRPTSTELAAALGLRPARRAPRQMSRVRTLTPVVLGQRISSAHRGRLVRRWGAQRSGPPGLDAFVPWRWSREEVGPSFARELMVLLLLMSPCLLVLLVGILSMIFGQ